MPDGFISLAARRGLLSEATDRRIARAGDLVMDLLGGGDAEAIWPRNRGEPSVLWMDSGNPAE